MRTVSEASKLSVDTQRLLSMFAGAFAHQTMHLGTRFKAHLPRPRCARLATCSLCRFLHEVFLKHDNYRSCSCQSPSPLGRALGHEPQKTSNQHGAFGLSEHSEVELLSEVSAGRLGG